MKSFIKFRLLFVACFFIFACVVLPLAVNADDYNLIFDPTVEGTETPLGTTTQLGNNDPATITYSIVNWSIVFLGLITVVMIVISGFMWIFAGGNEEKITKAQGLLKGAILGLLIVLSSYGASQYVFEKLVDITGETPTVIEEAPVE